MESIKEVSQLLDDRKSDVINLDNQITQGNVTLEELVGSVRTLKERIFCLLRDSNFADQLRSDLGHKEEESRVELKALQDKLEKARSDLDSSNDAKAKEIEHLTDKQQQEVNVITEKVQALLEFRNGELEGKRENFYKLREEYILKEQELDSLRKRATGSV